jgi:hypothetical protein
MIIFWSSWQKYHKFKWIDLHREKIAALSSLQTAKRGDASAV